MRTIIGLTGLLAVAALPSVAAGELQLADAWVRALPPVQKVTAAYLTISNTGSTAVEVTGGSAELAQRVEIHTSREVDGMMRMEPLPSLTVNPGESVALKPGGHHLMLLGLERMPQPGETVKLCLTLSGAEPSCTMAEVRKEPPEDGHHHHH
jgi:copper(I)-binding protein